NHGMRALYGSAATSKPFPAYAYTLTLLRQEIEHEGVDLGGLLHVEQVPQVRQHHLPCTGDGLRADAGPVFQAYLEPGSGPRTPPEDLDAIISRQAAARGAARSPLIDAGRERASGGRPDLPLRGYNTTMRRVAAPPGLRRGAAFSARRWDLHRARGS